MKFADAIGLAALAPTVTQSRLSKGGTCPRAAKRLHNVRHVSTFAVKDIREGMSTVTHGVLSSVTCLEISVGAGQ